MAKRARCGEGALGVGESVLAQWPAAGRDSAYHEATVERHNGKQQVAALLPVMLPLVSEGEFRGGPLHPRSSAPLRGILPLV